MKTLSMLLGCVVASLFVSFAFVATTLSRMIVDLSLDGEIWQRSHTLANMVSLLSFIGPWGVLVSSGLLAVGFLFTLRSALKQVRAV